MLFVNLPPELLQLIFLCSSTPSFVQLIRTCHTLFDLAAQSRGIVEHHLTDLPGGEAVGSLSTASTKELFLILRRRAAASLQGVNITADRQDFYFLDSVVDANASCVTSSDHHNIALVRKGWPSVQIYQVFEGVLKYRRVLDLSSGDREKYKLQQTVFDEANNVFILYGTEDTNQMPARPDHPRGKPSTRHSSGEARLVRVGLSDLFPTKDSWYVHGVIHLEPNKCAEPIRPINMAAWSGNKVSIVWDSGSSIGQVKYAFIGVYKLLPGD